MTHDSNEIITKKGLQGANETRLLIQAPEIPRANKITGRTQQVEATIAPSNPPVAMIFFVALSDLITLLSIKKNYSTIICDFGGKIISLTLSVGAFVLILSLKKIVQTLLNFDFFYYFPI